MPRPPFEHRAPRRILLSCTQRIGDVLLATPLARSLKQAWPQAELHFLVFKGTEGILQGNPDIARIITVPQRANWREKFAQFRMLWRRYDLGIATIASDRNRLYTWVGARYRVGFVDPWETGKTLLLDRWLTADSKDAHTVAQILRLTGLLGIAPCHEVVPPALYQARRDAFFAQLSPLGQKKFVVLHPSPKFTYKMWRQEGWVALAKWLAKQDIDVVLTGGPNPEEQSHAAEIAKYAQVRNLAGKLSLAETAELIARASLFVGPDTATTHIAAATGVPTVALFGPSNPVKWGPWPKNWNKPESPWQWRGSGTQGNVRLIQGPGDCVPCLLEGCERHAGSKSECLQNITDFQVIAAAHALLGGASFAPAPIPEQPIVFSSH